MIGKTSIQHRIFDSFNIVVMIFMMLITLYPIVYIVMASFSDSMELLSHTGVLIKPLGFNILAYEKAFEHPLIMRSYLNTIIIVVVGVFINILLTAIGAYFLTRKNVMFKKPISIAIIVTMFFNGGLIPFYFTVKGLHLYNSLWSLMIPTAINTFNLIVMRTGFDAIPDSLEESATIDGAGHFTILFKLMIPLAMPTVAVIILYYGVSHWNSWFHASIFLKDQKLYPLQLVLRQILLVNDTQSMTYGVDTGDQMAVSETIKYAVIVIATLPILAIYPFLQKYFVKGIMVGAVKG